MTKTKMNHPLIFILLLSSGIVWGDLIISGPSAASTAWPGSNIQFTVIQSTSSPLLASIEDYGSNISVTVTGSICTVVLPDDVDLSPRNTSLIVYSSDSVSNTVLLAFVDPTIVWQETFSPFQPNLWQSYSGLQVIDGQSASLNGSAETIDIFLTRNTAFGLSVHHAYDFTPTVSVDGGKTFQSASARPLTGSPSTITQVWIVPPAISWGPLVRYRLEGSAVYLKNLTVQIVPGPSGVPLPSPLSRPTVSILANAMFETFSVRVLGYGFVNSANLVARTDQGVVIPCIFEQKTEVLCPLPPFQDGSFSLSFSNDGLNFAGTQQVRSYNPINMNLRIMSTKVDERCIVTSYVVPRTVAMITYTTSGNSNISYSTDTTEDNLWQTLDQFYNQSGTIQLQIPADFLNVPLAFMICSSVPDVSQIVVSAESYSDVPDEYEPFDWRIWSITLLVLLLGVPAIILLFYLIYLFCCLKTCTRPNLNWDEKRATNYRTHNSYKSHDPQNLLGMFTMRYGRQMKTVTSTEGKQLVDLITTSFNSLALGSFDLYDSVGQEMIFRKDTKAADVGGFVHIVRKGQKKVGVAMSGGGIRSAALCAGMLDHILEKIDQPIVLSCVSGGGYAGASLVAHLHTQGSVETNQSNPISLVVDGTEELTQTTEVTVDIEDKARNMWKHQMANNSSYYAPWDNTHAGFFRGLIQSILLFTIIIVWIATTFAAVFPYLYLIASSIARIGAFVETKCHAKVITIDWSVVTVLIGLTLIFYLCSFSRYRQVPTVISGILLFATVIMADWIIVYYVDRNKLILSAALVIVLNYILVAILKKSAWSKLGLLAALAGVVVWLADVQFDHINPYVKEINNTDGLSLFIANHYHLITVICVFIGAFSTFLTPFFNGLMWSWYYELSLKAAFFPSLCSNIRVSEQSFTKSRVEYIGNTVMNGVEFKNKNGYTAVSKPFCTFSISKKGGTAYNKGYWTDEEESFHPNNKTYTNHNLKTLTLSSVMTMSAAAFSFRLGRQEDQVGRLGLSAFALSSLNLGRWVFLGKSKHEFWKWFGRGILCTVVVHIPWIIWIICYYRKPEWASFTEILASTVYLGFLGIVHLVFSFRGKFNYSQLPGIYRNILQFLDCNKTEEFIESGPVFLTDGGHQENLGLIPLLERPDVGDIYIMDGGQDDNFSCKDLIFALDEARRVLGVKFWTAEGGTDILNDLWMYSQAHPSKRHHVKLKYRLNNVISGDIYYTKGERPSPKDVSLVPKGKTMSYILRDEKWLSTAGFCCNCCSAWTIKESCSPCGDFPNHSTGNVFMHSTAFKIYFKSGKDQAEKFFANNVPANINENNSEPANINENNSEPATNPTDNGNDEFERSRNDVS